MGIPTDVGTLNVTVELGTGFTVAWHGGHGLHLYDNQDKEVGYRTVGDQSTNSLTLEQAAAEVKEWAEWIATGDSEALEFS